MKLSERVEVLQIHIEDTHCYRFLSDNIVLQATALVLLSSSAKVTGDAIDFLLLEGDGKGECLLIFSIPF